MRILVIAAHPDDEILGMGGTIKKYTKKGHKVKIVFMATGIAARRSSSYTNSPSYDIDVRIKKTMESQITSLQKDAKKATKTVGVTDVEFVDFPDNEMDIVSNLEITKKIEEIIDRFNPSLVFTHSPHDINIDHRLLYNATITATRPTSSTNVNEVVSYEVPSSTEWNFLSTFSPNIFVDITKELPFKLRAMSAYKNEIREFPHPRSLEALESISKRWGSVAGFRAAEAFSLIRQLQV